jgi:hypothetical protein
MTMQWARFSPKSLNNFDLILKSPSGINSKKLHTLLDLVLEEKHRGVTLSSRATSEFRRWFDQLNTPLKSEAYVSLSNWFLTDSGDRHSEVATCCESMWDVLFLCRPVERLSSPKPGKNHVILPTAFDKFWIRLTAAQGDTYVPVEHTGVFNEKGQKKEELDSRLRASLTKEGLKIDIEGSAPALVDFLKLMSSWKVGEKS